MDTWTTVPYYEAAWKRYVDAERAQRAIGRVLDEVAEFMLCTPVYSVG